MSRWLIATINCEIAPTEVTKTSNQTVYDYIGKNEDVEQHVPTEYNPQDVWDRQQEDNKVKVKLQEEQEN